MTDDEIISVVQAHKKGKRIQFRDQRLPANAHWEDLRKGFGWDFQNLDYRVAPEPGITRTTYEVRVPGDGDFDYYVVPSEMLGEVLYDPKNKESAIDFASLRRGFYVVKIEETDLTPRPPHLVEKLTQAERLELLRRTHHPKGDPPGEDPSR